MNITIGNKSFDVGHKSYIAHCAGLYNKGFISRFDVNSQLTSLKLSSHLISSFIPRYLGSRLSQELYSLLFNSKYSFLQSDVDNFITLGYICLYIYRSADIPHYLSLFNTHDKQKWLFNVLEEIIQYPPNDKLSYSYLNLPCGSLSAYYSLAKFYPSDILPNSSVLSELELNEDDLNSIDEVGILLRYDEDNFIWSSLLIRDFLSDISYRSLLWSRTNKLLRNLTT